MLTALRGNTSESAVLHALVSRGFHVLLPFGDGRPFDLVVGLGDGALLRVQVKSGRRVPGCVAFNTHATDHGNGPRTYLGRADLFGVYFKPLDSVYLVPVELVGNSEARLRIEPARNNQSCRVRLAEDFLIDRWSEDLLRSVVVRHANMASAD